MELPVLQRLDELVEMVADHPGLFVRISDGPETDAHEQSIDYESGLPLPGLSANRLDPADWWARPLVDWVARQVCQYAHLRDRSATHRLWVLTRRVVDRGPDDEPLLAEVRPIAWLGAGLLAEAQNRYTQRFERGRVSH